MNPALLSSVRMDWQTPDNVLALVRRVFGQIELDPCTTDENPTAAARFYTPEDDGLSLPWRGPVFCNPPYGRQLGAWCEKMAVTGLHHGVEVIGLIPSRTDTAAWHRYITTADAICFWRGRLKFKGAPASAPFPSALPYWGPDADTFRNVFSRFGWVK